MREMVKTLLKSKQMTPSFSPLSTMLVSLSQKDISLVWHDLFPTNPSGLLHISLLLSRCWQGVWLVIHFIFFWGSGLNNSDSINLQFPSSFLLCPPPSLFFKYRHSCFSSIWQMIPGQFYRCRSNATPSQNCLSVIFLWKTGRLGM